MTGSNVSIITGENPGGERAGAWKTRLEEERGWSLEKTIRGGGGEVALFEWSKRPIAG